jgi:hypothetical protein
MELTYSSVEKLSKALRYITHLSPDYRRYNHRAEAIACIGPGHNKLVHLSIRTAFFSPKGVLNMEFLLYD